jgi:hypothetical protein
MDPKLRYFSSGRGNERMNERERERGKRKDRQIERNDPEVQFLVHWFPMDVMDSGRKYPICSTSSLQHW